MDVIGHLIKALIREDAYDLLVTQQKYLEFAATVLGDEHSTKALEAFIACARSNGKCPKNINTVIRYVQSNPEHNPAFEQADGFDLQLKDIDEDDDPSDFDASVLSDIVYRKAYDLRLSKIYSLASAIATGGVKNPHTKQSGTDAAQEYIQEEQSKLVVKTPDQMGGELAENISQMRKYVNSFMQEDQRRVYTGIKKIDETTLIGRKQAIRWIGILGYTHHGKSLLLSTMLYNMACHGANIMLCPRESSVEDAMMHFIWLHHKKVCPDDPIVSRAEWMRGGKTVGIDVFNTVQKIMKDLGEGKTIPGKIVVFGCRTWEEIEEKLKVTNKKYNFDVLAIDYFGHLDTSGGNKKESDMDKHKKDLRKAQMLSLDGIDNDKSGLVIITPLQANKKGHEEAAKREGDGYGIYESMGAVEWFTQAAQDMDCVMSVWMEGDKYENGDKKRMLVNCMKGRNGMKFKTHELEVDPHTGLLYEGDGSVELTNIDRDRSMSNLSDEDINKALNTTVAINSESWER